MVVIRIKIILRELAGVDSKLFEKVMQNAELGH